MPEKSFFSHSLDPMRLFLTGMIVGALGWAICPLVSDRFEPFDTETGFYIGQALMSLFMVYTGWKHRFSLLFSSLAGLYLGQVFYSFAFGSDETRAWMPLGIITIAFLCIIPVISGMFAFIIKKLYKIYLNRHA